MTNDNKETYCRVLNQNPEHKNTQKHQAQMHEMYHVNNDRGTLRTRKGKEHLKSPKRINPETKRAN